jgi:hypothetical protein
MINAIGYAVQGLQKAAKMAEQAAEKTARMPQEDIDLAQEVVNLKLASVANAANADVIRTAREAEESLIDLYA